MLIGEGLGIVVRVGDNTMIGSIATLATATKEEKSTLEVRGAKINDVLIQSSSSTD
jgi:magnesium-transporting ATPase (P-type)